MTKRKCITVAVLATLAISAGLAGYYMATNRVDGYVLWRKSAVTQGLYPVAAFNTFRGIEYNHGNCEIAKELFQNQPGVTHIYRCFPAGIWGLL